MDVELELGIVWILWCSIRLGLGGLVVGTLDRTLFGNGTRSFVQFGARPREKGAPRGLLLNRERAAWTCGYSARPAVSL